MSMKRAKKATNSKSSQGEASLGFNPPTTGIPNLEEALAGKSDEDFVAYAPSHTFKRGDLVAHTKFGRGVIVSTDGSRAEMLFADGLKKLAHGVS
jgi:hypothetical protein